jgi:hypothetical protein
LITSGRGAPLKAQIPDAQKLAIPSLRSSRPHQKEEHRFWCSSFWYCTDYTKEFEGGAVLREQNALPSQATVTIKNKALFLFANNNLTIKSLKVFISKMFDNIAFL